MADGLEEAWKKMSLTEEDAQVLDFDEETPAKKTEEIEPSLVGKLMTEGNFNVRTMKNVWKPSKGLVIRDLDVNLFVFQFFLHADRAYVFNEGPWAFDGNLLLLKEWTGLDQPSEIQFTSVRFWVKVYDVPAMRQTKKYEEFIGSQIGTFVNYEDLI